METRLEQIEKKIRLSKVIDMNYIIWSTTIDDNTIKTLKENGYSVEECGVHVSYYYISW